MSLITIDDNMVGSFFPGGNGGLVTRDFKSFPQGCYAGAPKFDESFLIPEKDIPDLIRQQEADRSSLQHLGDSLGVKALDQNGQGYCHTADTEVLTEKGWVEWPNYNYKDLLATVDASGSMQFQAPFQKHVYDYDGEMVYSSNRRLDFGVTPDHRMMVRKWDERARTLSKEYTFQRAGEIGWYSGFMNAPRDWIGTELAKVEVPGDRRYDGDDFLAMISLVVSDGFAARYSHSGDLVSFSSFRPECRDRVAALAARVGFKEQPSRPGVWNRWGAGALASWIFSNCYTDGLRAQHKRVPEIVKVSSRRQIELFLSWNGDQNHNRQAHGEHYYSTSKRMIDDLQELCLRVGRRGSVMYRGPRVGVMPQGTVSNMRESWELCVSKTDNLCIERKKHIETDRYKGPVYCAAVPNGTLITRRNGSVLISGNCWAYSTTMAVTLVEARENKIHTPLSGHMPACIIKGYRDEGGWNAQSLEFAVKRGIASQKVWPQGSMSRSNETPEMWADAETHKVMEFWDLSERADEARHQLASLLIMNIPVMVDFNWWGHSVCAVRLMKMDPFTIRIRNSWSESWGDRGYGDLVGNKAIPNGAAAPRASKAA